MRASASDFRVDERIDVAFERRGEHLWLHLEKRLLDTADVLALLERVYAVGSADVGVSGLKDRRAIARQWYSVRTPSDDAPLRAALAAQGWGGAGEGAGTEGAALRVLEATRHTRKLRRGTHAANGFTITLRGVSARLPGGAADGVSPGRSGGEPPGGGDDAFEAALTARVAWLGERGFPNYIGPQRFGNGGRNVVRALAWFRQPKRRASRLQRGLWLSAARSALFNRVCAARVADGSWCRLLEGEPAVLDGSRSFFLPGAAPDGTPESRPLAARLSDGDLHPSAPWWGRGEPLSRGCCRAFEDAVLGEDSELRHGLERAGLEQGRRALRVVPRELSAHREGDRIVLSFELPPGAFATTLIAEFGECRVPSGGL